MTTRTIPYTIPALITLSYRALAGAQSLGTVLSIAQNTAPRIATDLYDLVGEPGAPANQGKQAILNERREAVNAASAARRDTLAAASKFCGDAVDALKSHLGRTWNPAWVAVGFTQGSIATARGNQVPVVLEIRNYLRDNPTLENPDINVTAAYADTLVTAFQAAEHAADTARSARKTAAEARDAAVRKLKSRLSGLREELDQLLAVDDPRWYEFGFSRPVDTRMPDPVEELVATPGIAGQVTLQFEPSARALDYRVRWQVVGSSGDPTDAGLFAAPPVLLAGLPSAASVLVQVTARNSAGETQPAEITLVVP